MLLTDSFDKYLLLVVASFGNILGSSVNWYLGKKILIYGLGKSGTSAYKFLKDKAKIYLFDDDSKLKQNSKNNLTSYKEISKTNFDRIILSPGIAINNCKLTKFFIAPM